MSVKEVRTLMKSGGSVVISLPKEWIEGMKLKPGDNVELLVTKDAIIVKTLTVEKLDKTTRLTYHDEIRHVIDHIIAAYLLGYNNIVVDIPKTVKDLFDIEFSKIKNKLMGLEIVEYSNNRVVLKTLIDPLELQPIDILKRMWQITRESIEESITSILEEDIELANRVILKDDEIDRLYFYMVRMLRSCAEDPALQTRLNLSNINLLDFRVAAYLLENINDRALDIASATQQGILKAFDKLFLEKLVVSKELLKDNHDDVYRVFFNNETDLLYALLERINKIKLELTLSRLTSRELGVYEQVLMIAKMQYDLAELSWIPLTR
ncbi:MAG: phosphate uptake regulator PhoU [Nitrososphaerota archaeon]